MIKKANSSKEHYFNILERLFLYTTLTRPEYLRDNIEKYMLVNTSNFQFTQCTKSDDVQRYTLMIVFGDEKYTYSLIFTKSLSGWTLTKIE